MFFFPFLFFLLQFFWYVNVWFGRGAGFALALNGGSSSV